MTYKVSSGTLNLCSINQFLSGHQIQLAGRQCMLIQYEARHFREVWSPRMASGSTEIWLFCVNQNVIVETNPADVQRQATGSASAGWASAAHVEVASNWSVRQLTTITL